MFRSAELFLDAVPTDVLDAAVRTDRPHGQVTAFAMAEAEAIESTAWPRTGPCRPKPSPQPGRSLQAQPGARRAQRVAAPEPPAASQQPTSTCSTSPRREPCGCGEPGRVVAGGATARTAEKRHPWRGRGVPPRSACHHRRPTPDGHTRSRLRRRRRALPRTADAPLRAAFS